MYEVAEGATIISIHAPARGATYYDKKSKSKHRNFNPRSRKGSDLPPNSINFCWRYFNPRSRKGSDTANIGKRNKNKISIHAPARGATKNTTLSIAETQISIHAPARGATNGSGKVIAKDLISIHAPARGATGKLQNPTKKCSISIHAPARGATIVGAGGAVSTSSFQSTLPQGERPQPGATANL